MKNRFWPLIGLIVLTTFLGVLLYATQAFSTVYYKKGVLVGSLAGAFEGSKYAFYAFGTLFFIASALTATYILLKRKNYGIHAKNANDVIKTFAVFTFGIFITMIISFTKSTPNAVAVLSWIVFAFGVVEAISLGIFTYKIYRT